MRKAIEQRSRSVPSTNTENSDTDLHNNEVSALAYSLLSCFGLEATAHHEKLVDVLKAHREAQDRQSTTEAAALTLSSLKTGTTQPLEAELWTPDSNTISIAII